MSSIPLPTITRPELAELPPAELLARSISMIIRQLGLAGPASRKEVIAGLDTARGALFGYWVLHTHGRHALTGFCAELPHRTVDADFWTLLEKSLIELGDDAMLAVVRRFEAELARAGKVLAEREPGLTAHGWDAQNTAALHRLLDPATMQRLDQDYRSVDPASLQVVAGYVRSHAERLFRVGDLPGEAR